MVTVSYRMNIILQQDCVLFAVELIGKEGNLSALDTFLPQFKTAAMVSDRPTVSHPPADSF